LFDGVGEGRGAQAEFGLGAGGVDDEWFVELVAHLADLADRPVDESERAHLPGRRDLEPRLGAGSLVHECNHLGRGARLGARQVQTRPSASSRSPRRTRFSPMSGTKV
jgi:hypothetical protein